MGTAEWSPTTRYYCLAAGGSITVCPDHTSRVPPLSCRTLEIFSPEANFQQNRSSGALAESLLAELQCVRTTLSATMSAAALQSDVLRA